MIRAAFLVLAACATTQPAPERAPDLCGGYQVAMAGPLSRMNHAADVFEDAVEHGPSATAKAARDLADVLDHERADFGDLHTGRSDLDGAHAHLVAAVVELAAVYRALAAALINGHVDDGLRQRLDAAGARFGDAVHDLRRVCPRSQSTPGA